MTIATPATQARWRCATGKTTTATGEPTSTPLWSVVAVLNEFSWLDAEVSV